VSIPMPKRKRKCNAPARDVRGKILLMWSSAEVNKWRGSCTVASPAPRIEGAKLLPTSRRRKARKAIGKREGHLQAGPQRLRWRSRPKNEMLSRPAEPCIDRNLERSYERARSSRT